MAINSGKFGLHQYVTQVKNLGVFDIDEDTQAKFEVLNAGPTNIFQVRGRIQGQKAYGLIGTIIGSQEVTFDISLFDFLEISCTSYDSTSTYVEIVGSGFHIPMGTTGGGDASAFNQSIQIGQLNNIIANQSTLLAELEQKTEPANSQNIRNLNASQDSVTAVIDGAASPQIITTVLTNANTEYAITLPLDTNQFTLKVRGYTAKLQLSFVALDSGSNFITIPRGCSYSEQDLKLTTTYKVLYVQTNQPNTTVECLAWV